METKEVVMDYASGKRKRVMVDVNEVVAWCYRRHRDLRDWGVFISARKGWITNDILRDINIQ